MWISSDVHGISYRYVSFRKREWNIKGIRGVLLLGQYTRKGPVGALAKICPLLKGKMREQNTMIRTPEIITISVSMYATVVSPSVAEAWEKISYVDCLITLY